MTLEFSLQAVHSAGELVDERVMHVERDDLLRHANHQSQGLVIGQTFCRC